MPLIFLDEITVLIVDVRAEQIGVKCDLDAIRCQPRAVLHYLEKQFAFKSLFDDGFRYDWATCK